jgi:hypothetical protein
VIAMALASVFLGARLLRIAKYIAAPLAILRYLAPYVRRASSARRDGTDTRPQQARRQ